MSAILESALTPAQHAEACAEDARQAAALNLHTANFGHLGGTADQRIAELEMLLGRPKHPAAVAFRAWRMPCDATPVNAESMLEQIDAAEDALRKARDVLEHPVPSLEAAMSLFHEAQQFLADEHALSVSEQRDALKSAGLAILDAHRLESNGVAHYTTVQHAKRAALSSLRQAVHAAGGVL